jgi:TnpA family transposase
MAASVHHIHLASLASFGQGQAGIFLIHYLAQNSFQGHSSDGLGD